MDFCCLREYVEKHPYFNFAVAVFALIHWCIWRTVRHRKVDPRKSLIVITGCDSGFGLGTATKLASQGYHVISTCMTPTGLAQIKLIVSDAMICNVTKEDDVLALSTLVNQYLTQHPDVRMWTLVNNAGIAPMGCVDWMSMDAFRQCIEVNYFAPVRLIKEFLPLLKQTKHSRIINLSSTAGVLGAPFLGPYGGSKHALEGMGKALREELVPFHIHVCHINPGIMNTPLIPAVLTVSRKYFDSAPAYIREQYNPEEAEKAHSIAQLIKEDPVLVVNAVCDTVTLRWPSFWNFVGIQAQGGRYFLFVPRDIMEWIQVTFNPAPQPIKKMHR